MNLLLDTAYRPPVSVSTGLRECVSNSLDGAPWVSSGLYNDNIGSPLVSIECLHTSLQQTR